MKRFLLVLVVLVFIISYSNIGLGMLVDVTPPVTTHDYLFDGVWTNIPAAITLTATDDIIGVMSVYYTVNGGAATAGSVIEISVDGIYTVAYWAVDYSGNTETPKSLTVKLDQALPVIADLQPGNGTEITQKQPTISAGVDDELSGVDSASIQLTLDGQIVEATYDSSSGIISYTPGAALNSGSHSVTLSASDLAGNLVTASSAFTIAASDPDLPSDPAEVAPSLDPTIVSDMKTATGFLYTGADESLIKRV